MDKITITAKENITVPLETIDKTIGDFIWDHSVEFTNSKIEDNKLILYVHAMAEDTPVKMLKSNGLSKLLKTLNIIALKSTVQKNIPREEEWVAAGGYE